MIEKAQGKSQNDFLSSKTYQPKSISSEITLEYYSQNYDEICLMIKTLAQKVAMRAEKSLLVGNTIVMVIKDAISWQRSLKQTKIAEFTNDFSVIYSRSLILLEQLLTGRKIRLVGVSLNNLKDKHHLKYQQLTIESYQQQLQLSNSTDQLIHHIDKRFDKKVVQPNNKYFKFSFLRKKRSKLAK